MLPHCFELINLAQQKNNYTLILCFGDDMIKVGVRNGVVFLLNVDIKSCDASNGELVFNIVGQQMSNFSGSCARGLLAQCLQTLVLVNPSDRSEVLKIVLKSVFEGSGTVLTTTLNLCAARLITLSFEHYFCTSDKDADIQQMVHNSAYNSGHLVTVEPQTTLNGIQFLKFTPMVCTHSVTGEQKILPVRNYGAIFRNFGKVDGDLTNLMLGITAKEFNVLSLVERMERFFSAVVQGYKNEPQSPVLQALRSRFVTVSEAKIPTTHVVESEIDYSLWVVDNECIEARYPGVTDWEGMIQAIAGLEMGDMIVLDALTRIYEVDYGL
jgi:hypothetical protein